MNKYIERARKMRTQLNNLTANFNDEEALNNKELYQNWNGNGVYLTRGAYVYYNDDLFKVNQDHKTQNDWAPDITPALFTKVSIEEWPEWVQPTGSQDAYAKDAKTSHNSDHWISDYDDNVWEPGVFGWHKA